MELEVYDNAIVNAHEQSKGFKTTLAAVSIRDYNQDYGFSDQVSAIDVDTWETSMSGKNDKTMDAAIGIADYTNNSKRASRFLLVELRMKYTGQALNSKTSDMKSKSEHTRGMLVGDSVDERSFFIFNNSVAPCVKRRISSEAKVDKSLDKWQIVTPKEFVALFQFEENLPYKPESPIESIKQEGELFVNQSNFARVIKHVKYWLDKVDVFYCQYKRQECKALIDVIQEVMNHIMQHDEEITDDDSKLEIIISQERIDDYIRFLNK